MNFNYTTSLIRGQDASDEFDTVYEGCNCVGPCTLEMKCKCLFSKQDIYEKCAYLKESSSNLPILECSSSCSCALNELPCENRCVQLGITLPLEVFQTPKKGFGLRCSELIHKGRFVAEYTGEVIGATELKRRSPNTTYVLAVKENFQDRMETTYIDAEQNGNLARFINHSCEPNLYMVLVRIGNPIVHVGLFAFRDIEPYEELSYDYDIDFQYNTLYEKVKCCCGSRKCRIFLPSSRIAFC